jgi:putative acetyltransferase
LQLPFPSEQLWKERMEKPPEGLTHLVAVVDGTVVGQLGLFHAPRPRRRHTAHLGMAVHDEFHGKGVGTALMKAALDQADNWLNVMRVELTVFVDNEAAIALYKKCGFEIEGTHRKYGFRNGELCDTYSMARLRE